MWRTARLFGSGRDGTTGGGLSLHSKTQNFLFWLMGTFFSLTSSGGRLDHTGTHVEPTGAQHSAGYGRPSQDDGLRSCQYESSEEGILSLTPTTPLQHGRHGAVEPFAIRWPWDPRAHRFEY